jgi:glutamate-1-semialdehyde 2,1-aminomutase
MSSADAPLCQGGIPLERIAAFTAQETSAYQAARPKTAALIGQGIEGFYDGVPMHWMRDWPLPFPLLATAARDAVLEDYDGHRLDDFCLGDTGAMFGHAPAPIQDAIVAQAHKGLTFMLPTPDALAVGTMLQERFKLPHWQIAATASDANRYALRVARAVTGRSKILVFNGCYHGTVDETFLRLDPVSKRATHRPGLLGQTIDLTQGAKIVEFNDLDALEGALADCDVACVITEPLLTNCCMVLPDPGFHAGLRALTRQTGTLLLLDETHTISSGLGGYAGVHGLEPDIMVLGKPVAGGVPASLWGLSDAVATALRRVRSSAPGGHSGMGTTLSGNALAMAALRACLESVMTPAAYAHMNRLAARLEDGLNTLIKRWRLPWHVVRAGARVEFMCASGPLRNGAEALLAHAPALEAALHIGLLNRGCLIAPFHNMMLASPVTTERQVERLLTAFQGCLAALAGTEESA